DETTVRKAIDGRPYDMTTKTKLRDNFGTVWPQITKATIEPSLDFKSSFFSIVAEGKVQDTRKIVRAVVKRGSPSQLLYFKVE
ncbi:MAG TPA: hypothetical protein VFA47_00625, partial [Candidatus Manganitrophaceae bacterium]|nr:hypothetical protein [Candidatus Manganitrophaceae bacterium]